MSILTCDLLSRTQALCLHRELFLKMWISLKESISNAWKNPVDAFYWVFQNNLGEVFIKCF